MAKKKTAAEKAKSAADKQKAADAKWMEMLYEVKRIGVFNVKPTDKCYRWLMAQRREQHRLLLANPPQPDPPQSNPPA